MGSLRRQVPAVHDGPVGRDEIRASSLTHQLDRQERLLLIREDHRDVSWAACCRRFHEALPTKSLTSLMPKVLITGSSSANGCLSVDQDCAVNMTYTAIMATQGMFISQGRGKLE